MKISAVKIVDISNEKINDIYKFISSDKSYRIGKLINKNDKIISLIGDILIRTMITKYLNIKNKQIIFERNLYGKPFLKGYPNLNFNISHSEDFVLCAVDDNPVGCDIEKVQFIEYEEIARNFFSPGEFKYIFKGDVDFQLRRFYEIWTLKESYIKCCGLGLSMPLRSFLVDIDEYKNIKILTNGKFKKHILKKFDIQQEYILSVCSEGTEIPNNIKIINQSNLIDEFYQFCF